MQKFDRTGLPPFATYDMGPDLAVYAHDLMPGTRYELVWELASRTPADPMTARVCLTRFDSGRVLLWGEFEDGDRCWVRDDDEVARTLAADPTFDRLLRQGV